MFGHHPKQIFKCIVRTSLSNVEKASQNAFKSPNPGESSVAGQRKNSDCQDPAPLPETVGVFNVDTLNPNSLALLTLTVDQNHKSGGHPRDVLPLFWDATACKSETQTVAASSSAEAELIDCKHTFPVSLRNKKNTGISEPASDNETKLLVFWI